MKRRTVIAMKVYKPESIAGKEALARRVSGIHSEFVDQRIGQLSCGRQQRQRLLDTVIEEVRRKASVKNST